jgi:hypothetical protein
MVRAVLDQDAGISEIAKRASPGRRSIASKLIRRTVQQRDEIDPWSRNGQ